MKKIYFNLFLKSLLLASLLLFQVGCQVDDNDLELATYPTNPDVFSDTFSAGLNYAAFGGSDPRAFQVDKEVKYEGLASMRIAVPDFDSADGAYAGGVFFTDPARDLSGYNCLTFWAKATQPASIDAIGFGNDLGENKYEVSISGLNINSNWKKYYIPIPDPSKLKMERGMLFFSEGPENGRGYTFWIDEVKFEKTGTIAHTKPVVMNGDSVVVESFKGQTANVTGLGATFSLPDGTTQAVNMTKAYFTFKSSNEAVATVNNEGVISVVGAGTAVITASLGDIKAEGSLTINATSGFTHAPTPTRPASNVIAIFSDAYSNVNVDFYNGYWLPFQTTTSADFTVDGDNVLVYNDFNFVGIQFSNPTVDATEMSYLHLDIFVPSGTNAQALTVTLKDFGPNGADGGDDDTRIHRILNSSQLLAGQWNSIDLEIKEGTKNRLGQIIFEDGEGISSFYVDNIYFYKTENNGGEQPGGLVPTVAAPAPTHAAADVLSIFSNAYTNVPVTTYRTDWSSATLEDVTIAGKAVKKYSSLDFVGIETTTPTLDASKMTHVHMDVWSPDFTKFSIKLVDFGANGVYDGGGDDVEHQLDFDAPAKSGWVSYNIPLSDFKGLTTRGHLAQYILVAQPGGTSTVYVDNFYFYNDGTGGNGGGNNGGENNGGNEPTDHPAPTTPAPTPPARNAADVRSIFSSAYTNVPVDAYLIDWSASKQSMVKVGGKDVLKYYDLDYAAIATEGSKVVSINGMTHVHVDVWSPNFTNLSIKLSDFGSSGLGEVSYGVKNYPTPAQSQWISYDIPISEFEGLNPSGHIGLSFFSGTPVGSMILYVDNFYFYKK